MAGVKLARMKMAALTLLSLAALAGCSQSTTVSARFVDGRLAFIPISGSLECIYRVEVTEVSSGRLIWQVADPTFSNCSGGTPLFYGDVIEALDVMVEPEALKPGVVYEVGGVAGGSNYFSGRFRMERKLTHQLTDLPY